MTHLLPIMEETVMSTWYTPQTHLAPLGERRLPGHARGVICAVRDTTATRNQGIMCRHSTKIELFEFSVSDLMN